MGFVADDEWCQALVAASMLILLVSLVPVPLLEDPYEAIRQAYLVGMDIESEPIEDLGTESPEAPHVVASPISFLDSTPHVGHVEETARMVVRVQPTMSPSCSARIAEVAAMSNVAFRKRFRSPYEISPSSPPTLPVRKRYRGTSELVLSTDSEANELGNEEDSLDSDSWELRWGRRRVVETAVGDPLGLGYGALRHRELAAKEDQRYSTFEVGQGSGSAPEPERLERVSAFRQPTLTTWTDPEDGKIYIDVPTYPPPAPPIQTQPSPDWMPGSLLISPSHSDVPSPVSSPLISLTVPSPVATRQPPSQLMRTSS
ncbi:hypothetical protein Tco_1504384 [Tanacetum coccineum]